METTSSNSQRVISEAIRKIALGRSHERVSMSPGGMGGVGTARMIHGYVAKIHDDPSDEEFEDYGGTIDVGEFPDETASTETIIHKGVLLAGLQDNSGGVLIIPTLFSDVTIVTDSATRFAYLLNYSHADIIQLNARQQASIGVTELEDFDPADENSPDYNELEQTGNKTATVYTPTAIDTVAESEKGKKAEVHIDPETITQKVDQSVSTQTKDKLDQKVGGNAVTVTDKKITIGEESATEPLVLGNELAQLMLEFITECSKIMTPTLMGTMPAVNAPNFPSLASKIQKFLSKTAFTK